jgi:AhpD family alkylhydroperoxidase
MPFLDCRETELVALAAAMGSNCVPCIEFHIPQARKAGLTDPQISEAIQLADRVLQVPVRKVLEVALQLLAANPTAVPAARSGSVEAAQPVAATKSSCS